MTIDTFFKKKKQDNLRDNDKTLMSLKCHCDKNKNNPCALSLHLYQRPGPKCKQFKNIHRVCTKIKVCK